MTPLHLAIAPVAPAAPLLPADPHRLWQTLQHLFTNRLSALGIELDEHDIPHLKRLTTPVTGDVNRVTWQYVVSEIVRHGAVRVWCRNDYQEEAE